MLWMLLILKYTRFLCVCVCCELVFEYMALIRYANKYRYFYANKALLSRVHVETCRIKFFNLLNWVLFCCSHSRCCYCYCCSCCWCWCCYFSWMSLFLLWIYSFGYFHLLLPSFCVDIRIGCSSLASLIHLNAVMVFGTAVWTVWTQLNHDPMPHRAIVGFFSFFLFRRFFSSHSHFFIHFREFSFSEMWNTLCLPSKLSASQPANQPAISKKISVQHFDTFVYVCVCACVRVYAAHLSDWIM